MEDNQTSFDKTLKAWGREYEFMDNMEYLFGKDSYSWLIPTHPCIKVNYLERLYTKNQLRQILRAGMEFDEDEWDLNKKSYLVEIKQSNKDKKIGIGITVLLILSWFVVIQNKLIEYGDYDKVVTSTK